jgi:DNA-binding MarR family transcriptional regulator
MYHTYMGTTPDEAAAAVLETIPPAMRAIKERMRSARAANLSVSQFRMLLFVRRHPGTDLSAVADHMGTTLPSASQLMSRLVAAGMLARTVHPTERRHLQLTVTDPGLAALGECDLRTRQWLRDRLAGATPEQLERLTSALSDLLVLIEGVPGAPGGRPPEPRRHTVGSGTT